MDLKLISHSSRLYANGISGIVRKLPVIRRHLEDMNLPEYKVILHIS